SSSACGTRRTGSPTRTIRSCGREPALPRRSTTFRVSGLGGGARCCDASGVSAAWPRPAPRSSRRCPVSRSLWRRRSRSSSRERSPDRQPRPQTLGRRGEVRAGLAVVTLAVLAGEMVSAGGPLPGRLLLGAPLIPALLAVPRGRLRPACAWTALALGAASVGAVRMQAVVAPVQPPTHVARPPPPL